MRVPVSCLLCVYLLFCTICLCTCQDVLLQPDAAAIEVAFPQYMGDHSALVKANSHSVMGVSIRTAFDSMTQSSAAFQSSHEDFTYKLEPAATNTEAKNKFFAGGYDYMIATASPVKSDFIKMPQLIHFPIEINGVVPIYNLPQSFTQGNIPVFSGRTMCAIFRGAIRYWDDAAIRAENSGFSFAALPSPAPAIRLAVPTAGTATHLSFSTYCRKIDSAFAATIPISSSPAYPFANLTITFHRDLDFMNSAVMETSYSFAMSTLSNALAIKVSIGGFVNTQGQSLFVSTNSMSLNLIELGSSGYVTGTYGYDLTNPATPQAWPMLTVTYLYIDKYHVVTTCATKKVMLEFFLFFYESESVKQICDGLGIGVLPDIFVSHIGVMNSLKGDVLCLDRDLIPNNVGTASVVGLGFITLGLMRMVSSFYLQIDGQYTFNVLEASSDSTFDRHAAHELEVGVIDPSNVEDAAVNDPNNDVALIPAVIAGVTIQFQLPTQVLNYYAQVGLETGMPPLYPLYMDIELCAQLFLGQINSWDDPAIIALNPNLAVWMQASNATTNLTMIVASNTRENVPYGAIIMFSSFSESVFYNSDEMKRITDLVAGERPFESIVTSKYLKTKFQFIESENRLPFKMQATPGSISYRLISDAQPTNLLTDFQFIVNQLGGQEIVAPQQTSLSKCGPSFIRMSHAEAMAIPESGEQVYRDRIGDINTNIHWISKDDPAPGCYPLANMYSLTVNLKYSSEVKDACKKGLHALQFVKYFLAADILTLSINSLGFHRVTDSEIVQDYALDLLQTATCDGQPLVVVPPVYWITSSAISGFGFAVGAIGIACMLCASGVIWTYRNSPVIRASSPPFLLLILLGLMLFLASAIPWAIADVTSNSCLAFNWLINLGFTCVYVPLLAKTWRVYKIFNGQKLKVVKITNQKLALGIGSVICADVIFLIIWSAVSPLKPIEASSLRSGAYHFHTHCNVDDASGGKVFLAIEAAWKGLAVLWSALLAFNTRKIKAEFNESQAIAWAIYNTFFSSIIVIAVVVFVQANEDTLILLILLFVCWTGFSVFLFLFTSKFRFLFYKDTEQMEMSRSNLAQEYSNGFSFVSLLGLSKLQLRAYVVALKTQLYKAEKMLGQAPSIPFQDTLLAQKDKEKDKDRENNNSVGDNVSHSRAIVKAVKSEPDDRYRVDIDPPEEDTNGYPKKADTRVSFSAVDDRDNANVNSPPSQSSPGPSGMPPKHRPSQIRPHPITTITNRPGQRHAGMAGSPNAGTSNTSLTPNSATARIPVQTSDDSSVNSTLNQRQILIRANSSSTRVEVPQRVSPPHTEREMSSTPPAFHAEPSATPNINRQSTSSTNDNSQVGVVHLRVHSSGNQ